MKKVFSYILICLLFIGIFIPSTNIQAQAGTILDCRDSALVPYPKTIYSPAKCPDGFKEYNSGNTQSMCELGGKKWENNTCRDYTDAEKTALTQPDSQVSKECVANGGTMKIKAGTPYCEPKAPSAPSNSCGWTSPFTLDCIMGLLKFFAYVIMQVMSLLLWLAGSLLNFILNVTIIQMSAKIGNMEGIDIAWKTIRDVLNMAFIFVLLYNAILVIISRRSTSEIQKIIGGIVITALLINFSMFFTKIIIDASNIVTVGFYKSIQDAGHPATITNGGNTTTIDGGISGAFVNAVKISGFFSTKGVENLSINGKSDNTSLFILCMAGAILFLILALVFFAVSALFIVRFITLIFLLIISPVGFIGFGLPQLRTYQDQWWKTLLGQAIFAPLYMIMTWAILTLISSKGFIDIAKTSTGQPASWASLFTGGDGSGMGLMLNFVLVIGLVILSLKIAKDKSSEGSNLIGQFAGQLTTLAGGAMLGGGALLARQTLGRAGNNLANREGLKDKASKSGIGGWAARQTLKASNVSAQSTFDARSSMTKLSDSLGVKTDFGKSGKTTVKSVLDAKVKSAENFAKTLAPSVDAAKAHVEETEKYFKSDEYKKTDIYKNAEAEKENNEAQVKAEKEKGVIIQKEIDGIEKEKEKNKNPLAAAAIDRDLEAKKKNLEDQNEKTKEVEAEMTKNRKEQDARDKHEKEEKNKNALKSKRINSYANVVEDSPWYMRYATNAFTGSITTRGDRKIIGLKIRAQAKEENTKDKAAKLLKEMADEDAKEKGTVEPKKDEGTQPTLEPKPTPSTK